MEARPAREPRPNTSFKLTALDPDGLDLLDLPYIAQRFWSKVDRTEDPDSCWLWKGEILKDGFGRFEAQGRRASEGAIRFAANRAALFLATGRPLTAGMSVSPTCGTSACVNYAHLVEQWPVTSTAASIERGRHRTVELKSRPACPYQHPYDEQNTVYELNGGRKCLECRRLRDVTRGPARRSAIKQNPAAYERLKAYDRECKARIRATDPQRLREVNRRWYRRNRAKIAAA